MRTAGPALLLLSMSAASCGGDDRGEGWYRVLTTTDYDSVTHIIAQADPVADTCVILTLGQPSPLDQISADVQVSGASEAVIEVQIRTGADTCTTERRWGNWALSASGTVKFKDLSNTVTPGAPCRVSFDVAVYPGAPEGEPAPAPTMLYARDFPILRLGCPEPKAYVGEYTDLSAAYGEHNGRANLLLAAWDEPGEVCVWARFLAGEDPDPLDSEVVAPDSWVYTGLRFGLSTREACVASQLLVPPANAPYMTDSVPALDSSGSVSFVSSESAQVLGQALELPCALDVDLALSSRGRYHWTPDEVLLHGSQIPVAGACE